MHEEQQPVTHIGRADFRHHKERFGIKETDKFSHIHCIGKSGSGKSTLLSYMAIMDILNGNGIAVIDPHGDVATKLLAIASDKRKEDIVYFDPIHPEYTATFNPLADVPEQHRYVATANLIATFKKVWEEFWGPRLEHILRYSILTLMSVPDTTLLHIRPLLTDPQFRNQLLDTITDAEILAFWEGEYDQYSPSFRNTAIAPILNKIGIFHSSLALKNTFGQAQGDFTVQDIMDNKKVFIASLPKGQIGEEATKLLGSILTTAFMNAAMWRSTIPEHNRVPFFLYLDECGSLINSSISGILSECRKYKLGLFLAHQYLDQLDGPTKDAIFGNVGTLISFCLGSGDAPRIAREFQPTFDADDLQNLSKPRFCIKLMIDGVTSKPFSATSILYEG